MKTYALTVPREDKNGKTHWNEIGTLFVYNDNAEGINGSSIALTMFPDLKIKVYHRDKKRDHNPQQLDPEVQVDDDSSIPF